MYKRNGNNKLIRLYEKRDTGQVPIMGTGL